MVFSFRYSRHGFCYVTCASDLYVIRGLVYWSLFTPITTKDRFEIDLSWQSLKEVMLVNTNLMILTICLLVVTNHFISIGSSFSTEVLAANAVLFQIHYLMAYLFDDFANASSVFSGKAKGTQNMVLYNQILRWSLQACVICPVILIAIWFAFDTTIIKLLTNQNDIINLCLQYHYWLVIFPIVVAGGLIYYGIFSGISYTSTIRDSMILTLLLWLIAQSIFMPI